MKFEEIMDGKLAHPTDEQVQAAILDDQPKTASYLTTYPLLHQSLYFYPSQDQIINL